MLVNFPLVQRVHLVDLIFFAFRLCGFTRTRHAAMSQNVLKLFGKLFRGVVSKSASPQWVLHDTCGEYQAGQTGYFPGNNWILVAYVKISEVDLIVGNLAIKGASVYAEKAGCLGFITSGSAQGIGLT